MDPNVVLNRIARLARLDTSVFDEVKDDPNELIPALIIAVVSAFLAGFGAFLYWQVVVDRLDLESAFVNSFILGGLFLAIMYGVAVLVTYVVLVQMYKAQADLQSLFRTMGYAAIPLALSVFMFIPVLFPLFALFPLGLLFVMMIYAVRAGSTAQPEQVVIATGAGFAVMVLVLGIIAVSSSIPDVPIGAGVFGLLLDL
jgi:hypothetical protein